MFVTYSAPQVGLFFYQSNVAFVDENTNRWRKGIRHVRLDGIIYFAATDLARLVLWDNASKTPTSRHASHLVTLAAKKDEILQKQLQHTYTFSYVPG